MIRASNVAEALLQRMKAQRLPGLRFHRRRGAVVMTATTQKGKSPMTIDMLQHSKNTAFISTVEQEIAALFSRDRLSGPPSGEPPNAGEVAKMRSLVAARGIENGDIAISKIPNGAFRIHVVPAQPKPAAKTQAKGAKKGGKR
jgi:hypothetical protein